VTTSRRTVAYGGATHFHNLRDCDFFIFTVLFTAAHAEESIQTFHSDAQFYNAWINHSLDDNALTFHRLALSDGTIPIYS
jgi:hypothetical protein